MTIKRQTKLVVEHQDLEPIIVEPADDMDWIQEGGCFIKTESSQVFVPYQQLVDLIQALTWTARQNGAAVATS